MTSPHRLIELLRLHRLRWPLERVVADPAGFSAECERLLRHFPTPDAGRIGAAGTLSEQWLELLFADPADEAEAEPPIRRACGR